MDEGYIKFKCNWTKAELNDNLKKINEWRNKLYKLGLIGAYNDGIGFGNISIRLGNSNQFIITGSETGNYSKLNKDHYTKVIDFDFEKNQLICEGPVKASSESLTHAAVYTVNKEAKAVIHVHNIKLWDQLKNKVPSTPKSVEYGTPKMAYEVIRLVKETDVKKEKIFVMLGHKEGIVAFGKDLNEAGKVLLKYFNKI